MMCDSLFCDCPPFVTVTGGLWKPECAHICMRCGAYTPACCTLTQAEDAEEAQGTRL